MPFRSFYIFVLICLCPGFSPVSGQSDQNEENALWRKHTINDQSPFEAAGAADFNGDGLLDVFSGDSWYEAPDWKRHKVREVLPGKNPHYYEDFADLPLDVNGDGNIDIVTCAYFSRRVAWVEHPGNPTKPWIEHTVDLPGSMETGLLVDLNSDGRPDFLPNIGAKLRWYEITAAEPEVRWTAMDLGTEGAGHGIGTGDINHDGKTDIITPHGWYEQPVRANKDTWRFHPEFKLGAASIPAIGRDFDGDGDTDILWGMGHNYGLHWLEQAIDAEGNRVWTRETIDTSFSQVHTLLLADLDGNGMPAVVTGKRIYAHETEPGATEPPCIYSFRYDRPTSSWIQQVIYEGQPAVNAPENATDRWALKDFERGSAGTGLQMDARDMDGDGDIDLVCPGKSGLYWFENLRISKTKRATPLRIELEAHHLDRLRRANAHVAAKKASVDSDPFKPIFHIMPAAGGCGDPNGLIYAKGKYHVFFQHTPEFEWGKPADQWQMRGMGWGHASSRDLAYWEHEPVALMPERGSYDRNICASGCAVIADDGTPTIFYTGAPPQAQCIARSQDPGLRYWLKDENNPILFEPDIENFRKGGFRDPFLWREGSTWQMVVCGALKGQGGMAVHYRSENLTDWKYVGPFATGMGEDCIAWEVPIFMRFGNKGVLMVSPLFSNRKRGDVVYTVATYEEGDSFTPGDWHKVDFGGPLNFYANHPLKTPDGRWLLWSMNLGGGAPGHHWDTHLSLPRVLTLRQDGRLGQQPPVELRQLRRAHWGRKDIALEGEYSLGVKSNTFEIIAEIEIDDAKVVGMDVRASDDFSSKNRIAYDVSRSKLHVDGFNTDFKLLEGEEVLRLHAFVDRSVLEVFVNRRECATVEAFHDIEHKGLRLFSEGGTARIRSVDVWEMGSIWDRPAEHE